MVETYAAGRVRLTEQCVGLLAGLRRVSLLAGVLALAFTLILTTFRRRTFRVACPVALVVADAASAVRLCLTDALTPLVEGQLRLEMALVWTLVGWAYSLLIVSLATIKGE